MDNSSVLSIIIFGSSARGESDIYSDLDVCVITSEKLDDHHSNILKKEIAVQYGFGSEEITIYSSKQIESMIEYGSLFLWHLKLEGKIVYDNGYFNKMLSKLVSYDRHISELHYHTELLDDIIISLEKFSVVNELDLSQLFTICRNACMILAHYNKQYAFGRNSAFAAANKIYTDLPIRPEEYNYLSKWKLRYERGLYTEMMLPSKEEFDYMVKITKNLLYYSIEKVSTDEQHTA